MSQAKIRLSMLTLCFSIYAVTVISLSVLVKLKQWPISCNKKIVCFFWGGVRHIQGWISKKYEGLSQLNLFHMLAHPHLNPSHHQVYFYPRWHPSTHSALYFTYCLCFFLPPLTIVPFFFSFHLPSSAKVQFPPPLLQSPTFPLFMIFHTHVSSFSFALQEHRRRVIYIYVCVMGTCWQRGTTGHFRDPYLLFPKEQVGGSSAQQDGLFSVPLKPRF